MIAPILIGVIIGMFIGRFFRPGKECPRNVLGYDCKGNKCDHSDSIYYEAKMHQAMNNERFNNNGRF